MKLSLISASLVMLVGCSTSVVTEAPAPQPADPGPAAPAPPEPAQPTACETEAAKLQTGIDGAHAKTTDVVLAVKTPSCGLRVLSSGPSHVDASKLHRIGSVTKTYTTAVVLSLVKDGTVKLEDPVSKWVEGVPNGDSITVRNLLTHQSGIFNYTDDKTFEGQVSTTRKFTPKELVGFATAHDPYFAPGSSWHYSNTNFVLLGMIAEAAGKAKLGALVRARVLDVAGLGATFLDGEEPVKGDLAKGQDDGGDDVTTFADPSWAWAAGAMVATPADVIAWIEKVGSGSFYDASTQKLLLDTVPTDEATMTYGLGIMVLSRKVTGGGGDAIGHGGDIPGYHTQAFYYPEKQTTIVSIVDSDADNPNDLSIVALKVLWGK